MHRFPLARPVRATGARSQALFETPLRPRRARLDADRIVGLVCALLLPVALWLAWL